MKATLVAIGVGAILAATTMLSLGGDLVLVTRAIVTGTSSTEPLAHSAEPHTGYIAYEDRNLTPPEPGCSWIRLPIYDTERNVVGWRGRPLVVCP